MALTYPLTPAEKTQLIALADVLDKHRLEIYVTRDETMVVRSVNNNLYEHYTLTAEELRDRATLPHEIKLPEPRDSTDATWVMHDWRATRGWTITHVAEYIADPRNLCEIHATLNDAKECRIWLANKCVLPSFIVPVKA